MPTENNNQKQQHPVDVWVRYQEQQTKLWLRYWTSIMNSLFNTDLKK
jgi:hypothetical protein